MSIVLIVIYCAAAALFIFGLTFHDEIYNGRHRPGKPKVIAIDAGKQSAAQRHRHA